MYGKTSTAENPHGEPHAWFNGFFDFEGQTYSLVVLVENGGGGGAVASPIAGEIVKFFTSEQVEMVNKWAYLIITFMDLMIIWVDYI